MHYKYEIALIFLNIAHEYFRRGTELLNIAVKIAEIDENKGVNS